MCETCNSNIYSVIIYNKRYILKKYHSIIINSEKYIFLGKIISNYIPDINCIYINNNDKLIKRYINKDYNKNIISFEVNGEPKGKGRPRFARMGNFVRTYTDNKTITAESSIREAFKSIHGKLSPIDGKSVSIDIECHMPIPKSLSNKKREALISTEHMKKPDIDNLCKSVLDALNGEAYIDDSLISELICRKIYSLHPKTMVKIKY